MHGFMFEIYEFTICYISLSWRLLKHLHLSKSISLLIFKLTKFDHVNQFENEFLI